MAIYDTKSRIWSNDADPSEDFVQMDSYLGEAIFKRFNEADPRQIAEINGDTSEVFTIQDIHQETIAVAMNLQELGIGPDDKVVIFCRLNSHISSIIYACYSLGIPYCPLDIMNYDLEYLFDYIEPTVLICDKEFIRDFDKIHYSTLKYKFFFGINLEDNLFRKQDLQQFVLRKSFSKPPAELVASLILTSGSTGKPKVAKLSHSMMINSINALQHSKFNSPNDFLVSSAGLRWISHIMRMLCPIFYKSPQIFTGKDPDPQNICEIMDKFKGTILFAPNSFLQSLLNFYKSNKIYDFSSLKTILTGGETPMECVNNKWKEEFPGLTSVNGYGITEVSGLVALNKGNIPGLNGGSIYKGYQVRIVGEDGRNLGPEECGVVYIKLRTPFLKYLKRPEDDKKSYTSDGWFITGDYGKMTKEHYLHIFCRFKDIPKCKGMLLIPNSVEEYINQHPLVNLGVVVGVKDKIVIFIKLVNKKAVESELDVYLRQFVDYEIVEKVVYLEKFKITSTGKVDKGGLKEGYLKGEYNY
ncbi:hypothetical protein ACFFRR_011463 [Megaselia abdita]